jgi:6-phosphogluconolactonase (cycloisomerase 2 family)
VTQLVGCGPNKERQEGSHAHQAYYIPELGEILVPDLGGDRVYRFAKDGSEWKIAGHIQYPEGSGPRHVVFYSEPFLS